MVYANDDSRTSSVSERGTAHCRDCGLNFTGEEYLLEHLHRHHIKQPKVILERCLTPIKLTIKGSKDEGFRIVSSTSPSLPSTNPTEATEIPANGNLNENGDVPEEDIMQNIELQLGDELETTAPPILSEEVNDEEITYSMNKDLHETVPGGEPTPPPDTEIPKIRIKSGLVQSVAQSKLSPGVMEEILTPGSFEKGHSLSNLFTNNDRAKDLGFTTSDPDFIPQELGMQPYRSASGGLLNNNPLATINTLPMQEIAQQVSRLQATNGMQQQNVLINIQQFQPPQPPVPHSYPSQMYQSQAAPPMYQHGPRYHYPSGGHMYYPPPPQGPPPGYPQMPPHSAQMVSPGGRPPSRPTGPPIRSPTLSMRGAPPYQRGQAPQMRSQPPPQARMAPHPRSRTGQPPRARMPILQKTLTSPKANVRLPHPQRPCAMPPLNKRPSAEIDQKDSSLKKFRIDTLVPDQNDDADCEVVAVSQKTSGLPQIQSIQGNVSDANTVHLSDSITLTTIPPSASPKQKEARTEAKQVANVLASRGITVTPTQRSKEVSSTPSATVGNGSDAVSINLNNSVCIIPQKKKDSAATVDLTDDQDQSKSTPQSYAPLKPPPLPSPGAQSHSHDLPFECHMCPAKFPSSALLVKHRKAYHRTNAGPEFGIPLIDLQTPGVTQRLANFGIYHYIPLPNSNPNRMFALPILGIDNLKATSPQELASSILTLGPIKPIIPPRHVVKRGKPATSA